MEVEERRCGMRAEIYFGVKIVNTRTYKRENRDCRHLRRKVDSAVEEARKPERGIGEGCGQSSAWEFGERNSCSQSSHRSGEGGEENGDATMRTLFFGDD